MFKLSAAGRLLVYNMGAFLFILVLMTCSAKSVYIAKGLSPIDLTIVDGPINLDPKPCSYSISGTWANTTELTISPYPPKANQPTNLYFKFTAVNDLWFGNIRGNVTRLEDEWVYSFDKAVCGSKGVCPIRKGETRVYNETFPSLSTFVRSGTYRAWVGIVNQDDEMILSLILRDCPL